MIFIHVVRTPCTRLPFSAFLAAALLVIGVIHYTTAVLFCKRRPSSLLDLLTISTVPFDGGALEEAMSKTECEAQLSIQRSVVDKNGRVLMHKIVNRRGKSN